jgi:hypothetical protein
VLNKSQLAIVFALLITSCAKTSMQQDNTKTLYEEYKSAYQYYAETEENYIILLSNLERHPKDEYLLMRKQILRKDIEQNRTLMLQARNEFEKSLREWDIAVQKMENPLPSDSIDLRQIFGFPTPKEVPPEPLEY